MSKAPTMIWIETETECPYYYEKSELYDAAPPLALYIRDDLISDRLNSISRLLSELSEQVKLRTESAE